MILWILYVDVTHNPHGTKTGSNILKLFISYDFVHIVISSIHKLNQSYSFIVLRESLQIIFFVLQTSVNLLMLKLQLSDEFVLRNIKIPLSIISQQRDGAGSFNPHS